MEKEAGLGSPVSELPCETQQACLSSVLLGRLRGAGLLQGSWPPRPLACGRPFLAGQRDPAAVRGGAAGG